MVWLPVPRSLGRAILNIFGGTWARAAWKLFVLVAGSILIYYVVATTSSWTAMAIVGIVVSIALSSTIRSILYDIWFQRWFKL